MSYTASRMAGLDQNRMRSQQEILDRITDCRNLDECDEYMRQAKFVPLSLRAVYQDCDPEMWGHKMQESCNSIDESAKRFLTVFERHVRREHGPSITRSIAQYRAWKWLLGHRDADTFHMSQWAGDRWPLPPLEIYRRLMGQVTTGEWDQMTKESTQQESETIH